MQTAHFSGYHYMSVTLREVRRSSSEQVWTGLQWWSVHKGMCIRRERVCLLRDGGVLPSEGGVCIWRGSIFRGRRGLHLVGSLHQGEGLSRYTWDMVNKRAVRILLECFLVFDCAFAYQIYNCRASACSLCTGCSVVFYVQVNRWEDSLHTLNDQHRSAFLGPNRENSHN